MNRILATVIISLFMLTSSHGQNYWFGFLTSEGDTMNRKDSSGYWQGLHVIMNSWGCNELHDTCEYIMGFYEHGQPVGNWIDYKNNGTFSIGQYNSGIEVTPDGKGGYTEKHQGIYAKIGIWQYFDRDSNVLKTERYDRSFDHKGWTVKTYLQDSSGNFTLTEYEYMNQKALKSPFKIMIHNNYNNGKPETFSKRSLWTNGYVSFYSNGHIKEKYKCRKFLGFKFNRSVLKKYSENGELIEKIKSRCWWTASGHGVIW